MTVRAMDCVICELEHVIRARSGQIRRELQVMNPVRDRNYDRLFQVLIEVDRDLGTLKGRFRKQRNTT